MLDFNGTILFVFVSFLIFVFLMKHLCYLPILKVIEERQKLFEKNKNTVIETNRKKEDVTKEIESEISKAHLESSKLLKAALEENKKQKDDAISNKKSEISSSMSAFEGELNENIDFVKSELKVQLGEYSKSVVSKILDISENEVNIDSEKIDEALR